MKIYSRMTLIMQVPGIVLVKLYIVWSPLSNGLMAGRDWSVTGSANNEVIIQAQVAEQGLRSKQMNNEFTSEASLPTGCRGFFPR